MKNRLRFWSISWLLAVIFTLVIVPIALVHGDETKADVGTGENKQRPKIIRNLVVGIIYTCDIVICKVIFVKANIYTHTLYAYYCLNPRHNQLLVLI